MLTEGVLLDTTQFNLFFHVDKRFPSATNTRSDAQKLYFVQCGVSIKAIHYRLFKDDRALRTGGSSNGQTIVGALSTCTHGPAVDEPPIQDSVVRIHLIVGGPKKHIWLK